MKMEKQQESAKLSSMFMSLCTVLIPFYGRNLLAISLLSVFETSRATLHPVLDQIRPDELDHPSVVVAVR